MEMNESVQDHVQVRSHLLGEFVTKVIEASHKGYHFSPHEVYRLGREYIADLRLVPKETFYQPSVQTLEKVAQDVAVEEAAKTHAATVVPDWALLNRMVRDGDKDGLESYCKPFGINLKKTKSVVNMLKDFKTHVGA